jgi:hypothetical protein
MGCNSFPQTSREIRLEEQARQMASSYVENRTASRNRREQALDRMSADELAAAYKRWLESLPQGDEVLGHETFVAKSGRTMQAVRVMPRQLRHAPAADKARHRNARRAPMPANRYWVRRAARAAAAVQARTVAV